MKESDAVDAALAKLKRNDDDSVDEKKLIDEVAALLDFDEETERHNKASRAVARRRKPGSSDPAGQLTFEGMVPYGYEPRRLILDNEGHIVEQEKARPEFKRAEAERARKAANRAQVWANRKTAENEAYAAWAIKSLRSRRRASEITFDTFVRETGIWSADPADPEPGPDDTDSFL